MKTTKDNNSNKISIGDLTVKKENIFTPDQLKHLTGGDQNNYGGGFGGGGGIVCGEDINW